MPLVWTIKNNGQGLHLIKAGQIIGGVVAIILLCGVMGAATMLISAEAGMMIGGFAVTGSIMLSEAGRRTQWEMKTTKDIHAIAVQIKSKALVPAADLAPIMPATMSLIQTPVAKVVEPKVFEKPIIKSVPAPANDRITNDRPATIAAADPAIVRLIDDAVTGGRVEMFLQPVMRLPQRKVRYYELYARLRARAGVYMPASDYASAAMTGKKMEDIDRLLLTDCLDLLRTTRGLDRATPFFVNVGPGVFRHPGFMQKLLAFLGTHRDLSARLIFEMPQDAYKSLNPAVIEIMKGLSKLGCQFSMDHVHDFMALDPLFLREHHVGFIKIEAGFFLSSADDSQARARLMRLRRALDNAAITVIAERVETEAQGMEIIDFDIAYGQGHLYGKPDVQGAYQQRGRSRGRAA